MSETIASMTELDYRKDSAGRYYWVDTEENKRLKEQDALDALGSKPGDRQQEPMEAVWTQNGHEIQVIIDGFIGRKDGEDYLHAKGSNTGIARSKLNFKETKSPKNETNEITLTPEIQEIIKQAVHEETKSLREDLDKLRTENAHLQRHAAQVEEENRKLKAELAKAQEGSSESQDIPENEDRLDEQLKEEFGDHWVPRKESNVNVTGVDGYLNDGYTVLSDPEKGPDGDWYVDVQRGDEEPHREWVGNLSRTRKVIRTGAEVPSEVDTPPTIERPVEERGEIERQNAFRRATAAIGGFLVGRQVGIHNGYYNLADRWGRNRTQIETTDGIAYIEEDEHRGAVVLGAVALAGVAGLVGYLIGHKTGHNVRIPSPPKTITVPGSGPGHTTTIIQSGGGRHLDHYNPSLGWKSKTGIEQPASLHLRGSAGNKFLADSNGNVVVPHKYLEWDRQGNLGRVTRAYLKAKKYFLTQSHVPKHPNRRMTEIWQR